MTIPEVTNKSAWIALSLDVKSLSKGDLCFMYRLAMNRIGEVKGVGKRCRAEAKAAEERLEKRLHALAYETDAVTLDDLRETIMARDNAVSAVQDLEYHYLETAAENARAALFAFHETRASWSEGKGVTFTNGAK